jgi:hypothetical protein
MRFHQNYAATGRPSKGALDRYHSWKFYHRRHSFIRMTFYLPDCLWFVNYVIAKTFTPNIVTSPQNFSLGAGGTFSSDAFRQDKLHILYKISELVGTEKDLPPLPSNDACVTAHAPASLFLQSDLKISDWLHDAVHLQDVEEADFTQKDPLSKDAALSHEIKFEIVSGGNLTPAWKLVRVSANQTAPFFNTTRDRTQDLIITMGPPAAETPAAGTCPESMICTFRPGQRRGRPTDHIRSLAPTAQNSAFASEIAASIVNALRASAINP